MKKTLFVMLLLSQIANAELASWYSKGFEGKTTASGYIYNSSQPTCASNKHKFGTVLKVTNRENKKSVNVVVTDRGSFDRKYGRHIDLSKSAFKKIDKLGKGIINVDIEVIDTSKIFRYKHGNPLFKPEEYSI